MKIIVPLNCATVAELKQCLGQIDDQVDVVEIWVDLIFQEFVSSPMLALQVKQIINRIRNQYSVQFLAVCKTPSEKGSFTGNQLQRQQILLQFLKLGGDFIDLDVSQNLPETMMQIPSQKLWLSFHDFENADLETIKMQYESMKKFNPYCYKFAVTPQSEKELESFAAWAKDLPEERAIFTTMGEFGSQGREKLVEYTWGAFYALDESHRTAEGQPTLDDL